MTIGFGEVVIVVVVLAMVLPTVWASSLVVKKAGFSRGWALLLLVPLVNLVAIWIFAFIRWPALSRKTASNAGSLRAAG
jgi:hypothetical protein